MSKNSHTSKWTQAAWVKTRNPDHSLFMSRVVGVLESIPVDTEWIHEFTQSIIGHTHTHAIKQTEGQFRVINQADVRGCGRKLEKPTQALGGFRQARAGSCNIFILAKTHWTDLLSTNRVKKMKMRLNAHSRFRRSSDLEQREPFLCKRIVNWPLFPFGLGNYSSCMFY